MNTFCPLRTQPSSTRSAIVSIDWRSLPAPGSVIAIAPIASPLAIRGSQCDFCSSVP
jgi:hypothetical protein